LGVGLPGVIDLYCIGGRVPVRLKLDGSRPNCHIWYSSLRYRSLSRRFECRVLLHSLLIVSRLWAYDDCLAMNVNQSQSLTPFPDDYLPPESEYESREAIFEAINAWAATRGYAFITGRSTKEKTGRRTIPYMCDRRRNHRIVSRERQRKTTTRTTGCEFSVLAKENKDRSTWTLRHRFDSRFLLHNHEPSQDTTAHLVLRTISKEHLSQLTSLANAGIAPKEIRTFM